MDAYRFNDLVYIPITKHASTSYVELFRNRLNWKPIQTDAIDWNTDHVFAHLLHPYKRHLKGITECLTQYKLMDLVDNDNFLKLLGTAVFDLHSYPLATVFGDRIYKIDWLLLDPPGISSNYLTVKFLESYDIKLDENDIPTLNVKDGRFTALLDKISKIRDDNNLTSTLTYFYDQDVVLYGLVNQYTKFCEIDNMPWDKCSWLANYKNNS